jgi:multidrug efflux pump
MSLSDFFIHRPKGTIILAVGMALFGAVAFRFLPVAPLPQIEFPTISITATLPGANPDTMAISVATPLEKQLGQIAGVTELTSSSNLGTTRITIQFDLDRDINGAARDVQAAIMAARSNLPPNLPAQPSYRIVNPADAPIMVIAVTSETYDRGHLYDVASSILQQKLSQIDGVGQVIVGGGALPAVRVEVNPDAINHYGLSVADIGKFLQDTTLIQPKGDIHTPQSAYSLATNDQIFQAKDYQPLVVAYRNNAAIRLQDVADVVDSVEDVRNAGGADNKPAVVIVIYKEPGSNIIETVNHLYGALDSLRAMIPAAMELMVAVDRTTTIRASLRDVEMTLLFSIFLVIGVIYFFLNGFRTAVIPGVVIPLTILGTFGIMYLLGFSLNNLSLIALTIVTGFIVDDAVVVLENIEQHLEKGFSPLEAAKIGAKKVGFTVVSMSISLIVVFVPILFMGGMVGRIFREFAITIAVAILVSMVISLTMTPMLASRILSVADTKNNSQSHLFFKKLSGHYHTSLRWALRRPGLMLAILGITILINGLLVSMIPKGFFPLQDTGRLVGSIQAQQDMSFIALEKRFLEFMAIIKDDPAVDHVCGFAGGTNSITNSGAFYVSLKLLDQRDDTVFQVIDRLRPKLSQVPGATVTMQASQDLVIGGRSTDALFQYTLSAATVERLNRWVPDIQEEISKLHSLTDLISDQKSAGLETYITYDRDAIGQYGLSVGEVDSALYSAFGQNQITTLYTSINQYHVILEVAPKYWSYPDTLRKLYVTNSAGTTVPLSSMARFQSGHTLLLVNHQGQFPSATLSFNLAAGYSLGEVVNDITKTVDEINVPADIQSSFQGTAQAFQQSLKTQGYLIIGAVIVVYIVLGILYESFLHPITILSTLPSAGVGALLALMMTTRELSIIGIVGIIMLIGIVKKNAIMMIDFALDIQRSGHRSSTVSIYKACVLRFRPIMMTTCAALFGAIPMAIQNGTGAELRRPLGIAIVGGLILSQILTLYTTPIVFLALERLAQKIRKTPTTFS